MLSAADEWKLGEFARLLIDQAAASTIVAPQQAKPGFWFGGGNMIEDGAGNLYVVGRYRNQGDSRTGLQLGHRGLELAIFKSADRGRNFEKIVQFSKADLNVGEREVLSIEGSALRWMQDGVELFVSTEKTNIGYPPQLQDYLKEGTGVWTIERLSADSIEALKYAPVETIIQSDDPQFIHAKDPFVYDRDHSQLTLFYCTHPFCWSSSNTALAVRQRGETHFANHRFSFFPRGFTWDVAITRGTSVIDVPPIGSFADRQVSLMFYDGGESLRNLDEHAAAVKRPRGYSCEELGGAAYIVDRRWSEITRLSRTQPWFVSPHGTGCSRYVDVHVSSDGYFATWQQSQSDLSQPLVMHFVSYDEVGRMFSQINES